MIAKPPASTPLSLTLCGRPGVKDQAIFTYSNSPGCPLMPMRGGAIQLAYWPASVQGFIKELMKSMSAALGSQLPACSAHWVSVSSSPAGLMRWPLNSPILRLKPLCGCVILNEMPAFSMTLFQRSMPPWQSAM